MPNDTESRLETVADLSSEDRIDVICDIFESRSLAGDRPELMSFLNYCVAEERPRLFAELVLVEQELQSKKGHSPSWSEYFARFPEFAEELEAARFKQQSEEAVEPPGEAPAREPKRLAHFELLEILGTGAAATVWQARDFRLQRVVAIKIPHALHLTEDELGRFLREGRAAAKLQHPGIVSVHEVGREGNTAYIVSDLIAGENLRSRLQRKQPSPRQAAELCRQIASALRHAHTQGVIHRDLKPANILLDSSANPHIADFGLAKQISAQATLTLDSQILGTPAYMAPEQAKGESRVVDARSDIYSLGVMLYEMLTGRRPFEGTFDEVLRAVVTQQMPRPRQVNRAIPRDLELICIKSTEKLPSDRYQTAEELEQDLRRFLDGVPIRARRYRMFELAWRAVRRRLAIAAAVLVAFVATGASAWVWWTAPKSPESFDGPRLIRLATEPPGAKVLFVPISQLDGEPDPKRAVQATGVSPVEIKLAPGEYWVEAVLPDGRFHEVVRGVPKLGALRDNYRLQTATNGAFALPDVKIPDKNVTADMIYVPNHDALPFYVDIAEATEADLHAHHCETLRYNTNGEFASVAGPVRYQVAGKYAESVGKRLPTDEEWEHAQSVLPQRKAGDLAEWTSTQVLSPDNESELIIHGQRYADCCIVRGGSRKLIWGDADLTPSDYAAANSAPISVAAPYRDYPGIGIRCVRSAKPHFFTLLEDSSAHLTGN